MFLIGFLILFFLLIVYLLLIPIVLFIDTATNQYYIKLQGLAKASIEKHTKELLRIKLKTFFLKFYFYPLKNMSSTKKKTENKHIKKHINERKNSKKVGVKKVFRMLKSFKVKKILIDIDTGDCISNAKLYPLFTLLNYSVGKFSVNFEGRNRMVMHIQSRPIYIIKSFINL